MAYYDSIKDIVGNTPILKFNKLKPQTDVNLYAKLEYLNPGGSMKDRIGLQIIKEAEESGELKPGGVVIEATAGNTGIGLALAALTYGYRLILLVSSKFSEEKRNMMKALGAELIETSAAGGIMESMEIAEDLARKTPGAFLAHQFENQANMRAHIRTGEEIWEDMGGKVDILVAGAGSGGSICGIAKALKSHNPDIKVVLADPEGSILGGGDPGVYTVEGIGNHFIPGIFDRSLIDEVEKVRDEDAYFLARLMALKEGVIGASSSGEAFAAAVSQSLKAPAGSNIVMVFPDRADRYFSENIYRFEKELSDYDISDHIREFAEI